ncbi:zinc ribbon domain-containing protein [bacterium]|nr:zinc ribbon domain-containing protein [bacterium]NUN46187.1 zinc ribbon domain-containing protein [bacterium]HMW33284.1 zinc ribbon domain-containing protein [bacterium]HMY36632.1 zinc ribbon domain-containing protein [bacterium]HMZ05124.1 zinc ribbon domain-containing protein [bacterium]
MPTYDYKCKNGHVFEEFHGINDSPETVCPQCGQPAVKEIGAGSGLMFKGSGFYITDYKKNSGSDSGSKSGKE